MIKLILLLLSFNTLANDHQFLDKVDISGYAGYRYIYSSINTAPSNSFPELGLILNYDISNNFSAFLQMNLNEEGLELDPMYSIIYGFLSFETKHIDIHVGKLRHDIGLYNIYSVNPSTRSGVVAPQSIYWNSLKSTIISGYGINIEAKYNNFKIGYSISEHIIVDAETESQVWTGTPNVEMDSFFGSHQLVTFMYDPIHEPYMFKSSFSKIQLNRQEGLEFINIGFEYDDCDYNLALESLIVKPHFMDWSEFNNLIFGYSITLGYHLYEDLEIHTNYNSYERSVLQHSKLGFSQYSKKWHDISIGLTKSYNNIEFKTDIHKVYGGRLLDPSVWANDKIKDWWYIGTSLVYHF